MAANIHRVTHSGSHHENCFDLTRGKVVAGTATPKPLARPPLSPPKMITVAPSLDLEASQPTRRQSRAPHSL